MFTFLTGEYRDRAIREYRLRRLSIFLGLLAVILVIAISLSIPTFIILKTKKDILEKTNVAISASTEKDSSETETEISALNEKLKAINSSGANTSIVSVLLRLFSLRGSEIHIKDISLSREDNENTGKINVSGQADSRDALVTFSKRLQGEPTFSSVELPVSSFAKSKDIPWNMSIYSKF